MASAQIGNKVKVHYTGRLESGQIFDSSKNSNPFEFTIGDGSLIQGFSNAVI
ncbi:MAG: FKBP-type peptidyl-prolyl cis-trans isomerase [Ignavibacteriales bacterium]|nr:FKBP-type peptidyl-prolyl cis-trans isomerase [Ignavibacteriales bacterium]